MMESVKEGFRKAMRVIKISLIIVVAGIIAQAVHPSTMFANIRMNVPEIVADIFGTPRVATPSVAKARTTRRHSVRRTAAKKGTYIVKEGDTLYSIARRHKSTVKALRAINDLPADNTIKVGQRLTVSL